MAITDGTTAMIAIIATGIIATGTIATDTIATDTIATDIIATMMTGIAIATGTGTMTGKTGARER
jgi:hypothetical protein